MDIGMESAASTSEASPLAILLQPSCTAHKWIRTPNSSHIFERPERIRAVMVGVSAAVAYKEGEVEKERLSKESPESQWSAKGNGVEEDSKRNRSRRETTPDIANLLGSLSLGMAQATQLPQELDPARPSKYIYLPPVAFSPSPLAYEAIPTPSMIPSGEVPAVSTPTRARAIATAPLPPTLANHPSQPWVSIPSGYLQRAETDGKQGSIIPGSLLTSHPAARIVHSTDPPTMPIPFFPLSNHEPGSESASPSLQRIPETTYLPRLLHWSLRAPGLIKQGRCEIPKFYDDDFITQVPFHDHLLASQAEPSAGISTTTPRKIPASPLPATSTRSPYPAPKPAAGAVKDPHGRSPGEEGYGQGEETGLNQGDLYLGPGSIGAMEGCIRTVCQAVDLICGPQADDGPSSAFEERSPQRPPQRQPGNATSGASDRAGSVIARGSSGVASTSPTPYTEPPSPTSTTQPAATATSGPQCKQAFCVVRPPGHHCGSDTPSGFCYVNNVAIGAMHAYLSHDRDRAIILDFDLHHGNGTQSIVMALNEATHTEELQQAGGKPGPPVTEREMRLRRRRRGWKGFYGSLHDIWSYPCEDGNLDLIKDASVSLAGHGQYIENIHLEPYDSEEDFYQRLYPQYLRLLEKASAFMRATEADPERTTVFVSAGFDACQFEHQTMQRHDRRVPASFFDRFTRDIVAFADTHTNGKVISVLEGGYSDRALASGAMSHVSGFLSPIMADRSHWWTETSMQKVEKATKKKRTGGLSPLATELNSSTHLRRTHELLGILENWGINDVAVYASPQALPPRREGLRDRRKLPADALSPAQPVTKATDRIGTKAKSANTTPVHHLATPHKMPVTEGKPSRKVNSDQDGESIVQTPTHPAQPARSLVESPKTDFQRALERMGNMSMDEVRVHRGHETPTMELGSSPLGSLAAAASWSTMAMELDRNRSGASTPGLVVADQPVPDQPRNVIKFRMPKEDEAEVDEKPLAETLESVEEESGETGKNRDGRGDSERIMLKFKMPPSS